MFDIGFSELLVIGVVALVVLGPERLPRVARTAGHLFGRMQRYVAQVRSEINSEIELEELKRVHGDIRNTIHATEQELKKESQELETELTSDLDFASASEASQLELGLEETPKDKRPATQPGSQ